MLFTVGSVYVHMCVYVCVLCLCVYLHVPICVLCMYTCICACVYVIDILDEWRNGRSLSVIFKDNEHVCSV